jgi:hypothetical protein
MNGKGLIWKAGCSLLVLGCTALLVLAYYFSGDGSRGQYPSTPAPKRTYVPPMIVQPLQAASTWSEETIYASLKFTFPSRQWLAIDSKGHPALAYGGSQLNYAWLDGTG